MLDCNVWATSREHLWRAPWLMQPVRKHVTMRTMIALADAGLVGFGSCDGLLFAGLTPEGVIFAQSLR